MLRTTSTEGVGGANQVDVDIVPDLPEGRRGQQQQQAYNASAVRRAAAAAASSSSSEAPQQVGGRPAAVEASVVVKNNAGTAVGIFWLDEAKGQYIKLVRARSGWVQAGMHGSGTSLNKTPHQYTRSPDDGGGRE